MLSRICRAAIEAGKIIKTADKSGLEAAMKSGDRNFVTKYDVLVQKYMRDALAEILPEAVFIGEEDEGGGNNPAGDLCWIVDPIDGTSNFMRSLSQSAVSVALCDMQKNEPLCGVVYNPYLDELFSAEKGRGAEQNNSPLKASRRTYKDSLIGFGTTPYNRAYADKTFAIARDIYTESLDVRRSGSAALDLVNVAAGRLDGFFEISLSPWDYAAGTLIITEAGGKITNFSGGALSLAGPDSVVAGNTAVYPELYRIIRSHI